MPVLTRGVVTVLIICASLLAGFLSPSARANDLTLIAESPPGPQLPALPAPSSAPNVVPQKAPVAAPAVRPAKVLNLPMHPKSLAAPSPSLPLTPADKALLSPDVEYQEGPPIFEEDALLLREPPLSALVTIERDLSPFALDARSADSIDLPQTIHTAIDNNLDLAISRSSAAVQNWNYRAALGKFLPNLNNSIQNNYLTGKIGLPRSLLGGAALGAATSTISGGGPTGNPIIHIDSPFTIMTTGFQYYGYRGGSVLFGALEAKHNMRAARSALSASYADVLLTAVKNYYQLVLDQALLEIRVQAVRTSEEQLRINNEKYENGLATKLDVMQAKTQLSRDRQSLIDQQIARRTSAIKLADTLNISMSGDLTARDHIVKKIRLLSDRYKIEDLVRLAVENRPELKQYEELRLAAKRAIPVAGAALQPTFALNGNIYGIGPGISHVQALYLLGLNFQWNLEGMGTVAYSNVQSARMQARQALLQENKELVTVIDQVRSTYLQSLDAERKIEETSNEVASTLEELRLARLRYQHGLGNNIDIFVAQRDYTQALINKAQAIINFDIQQSQLVHDVGLVSMDNLMPGHVLSPAPPAATP